MKSLGIAVITLMLTGCAVVCAVIMPEQTAQDQRQGVNRVCVAGRVSW